MNVSLFLRPEVTVTMMSIDDDSDYGDILEFGIQETNGCQGTAVISDGELLSKTS